MSKRIHVFACLLALVLSPQVASSRDRTYLPPEVEQALKAHGAVFDCIVVGVPDERWGQRVAAVVQWRDGERATLDDLARSEECFLTNAVRGIRPVGWVAGVNNFAQNEVTTRLRDAVETAEE